MRLLFRFRCFQKANSFNSIIKLTLIFTAHTFSWGYGAPDIVTTCYNKNGEPISNWHGPLNPVNLRTYNFLKALFLEVTTEFPDEYFHLGGDETTFGCW